MSNTDAFLVLGTEINRLAAMVDRLRAALEKISNKYPDPSPAGMIARAALANEQEGK